MKPPSRTEYEPPIPFDRIRELADALDSGVELNQTQRLQIAIVLGDIAFTFGGRKRRRGRPTSETRHFAALAIAVAKKYGDSDKNAVSAVAPEADAKKRAAILRMMSKIRRGKVAMGIFLDRPIEEAGKRLKRPL